ncbi:hypothetical protein EJD97_020260 [Solanum chilense]|uniref:Uncharacterized protein n=1 Tax=Solanum chilense TaxID=4083 RepID=A0A6N2C501_SOLCI|nr:hypothetical protein EJD97_020260 [Solanum chilense]
MNIRRNTARRLKEEIANVGVPPRGDQVPSLEEDVNYDQAPANPPSLTNENIRDTLFQMAQAITSQAQAASTQSQAMTAQANREVLLRTNQQVATMACRLRYFTRMNHPNFYGSKVE